MESLGDYLKREREFRGISLEEVSRTTKINARFLSSLEANRWGDLPKGAFTRGFLRSYSSFLGVPFEEVLKLYEVQRPKESPEENPFRKFRGFEVKNRFFIFLVVALAVIILAAYLSSR